MFCSFDHCDALLLRSADAAPLKTTMDPQMIAFAAGFLALVLAILVLRPSKPPSSSFLHRALLTALRTTV
jgi:hypothetical protein